MESDLTVPVIEKIEKLVKAANEKDNRIVELDLGAGPKLFDTQNLRRIYDDPRPDTLEVSSLSAIAAYVRDKLEGIDPAKLFARIVSPTRVELLEAFSGDQKARTCFMVAKLGNDAEPFKFGSWYETEAFIIALMSLFENTEDRGVVLTIASSLVSEAKIAKLDNGSTTKTQANAGIINTSDAVDPGVAVLQPFRTFRQIEQPASSFLFRYRAQGDEVVLTLIEADGGAWKHEAMKRIADYFDKEVPELQVIA
jgi:hypothetical protein